MIERRYVYQRTRQGVPEGDFDLFHLRDIHKHLFQDIYEWAGQIRLVEMSKGNQRFQFCHHIATDMQDVHGQIKKAGYFQGLNSKDFSCKAGEIIGEVNFVHPFREGNGRTQLQYLKQLGERAGHIIDLRKLEKDKWIEASRQAYCKEYDLMASCIESAIVDKEKIRDNRSEELKKRYNERDRGKASQNKQEKDRDREH